ncbi:phosphotriesterase [Kitasatospora sp. NPDC018619]|uniref:phosphotriesterase family protein n=1 Tax=unclassified Kitasatospora TaxID=2633591 RepID=UPI00378C125A
MSRAVRTVRTVLGDLDPADLGVTDAHDHLFIRSPLLPGQELDDPAAAEDVLRAFAAAGGRTLVQWTPIGLGRGADSLAALSRSTGVRIVAATGAHQAVHYPPSCFPASVPGSASAPGPASVPGAASAPDPEPGATEVAEAPRPYGDLAERFVAELTTGLPGAPEGTRAGLIKVAADPGPESRHTRWTMAAAAEAHHATGAPIAVHLEADGNPLAVVDRLCHRHGVPPDRVILGHLTRLPDRALHRSLAGEGVYLALDSPSRAGHPGDHQAFEVIADLVEAGHAAQLLLGADTTTRTARAAGGPARLLTRLAPRLARSHGPELPALLLTANPAAALAADWRTP